MIIAVCDDQPETLGELNKMLDQFPFVKKVHLYSDIEIFLSILSGETYYDAVLMDIDWKSEKTGIDLAQEVHKKSPSTKIIYITAYTMEYVEDVFFKASNLSGFLVKPIKLEQLEKNLLKVQKQKKDLGGKLLIRSKGNTIVIPFQEIIYIENQLHKIHIVLAEREYWCYERLELLKERLNEQFVVCHKSYMVNMEQILEFRNREIEMTYGKVVPVSKACAKNAKNRFFEYMSEKM